MKKLILATAAAALYTGVSYLAAKRVRQHAVEIEERSKQPLNHTFISYASVDGFTIAFEEIDHLDGHVWNACATGDNRVIITRTLKESKYFKAALDHEVGHIVSADRLTILSSTADLFRIEWQADKYSVEQGNLDELFELRLMLLKKYWYAPVSYNTTNLVMLTGLKIKKALSK